ncbi:hypothetical protein Q2T40_02790 [Winogradskyella maritima]|nr:hypothetical protein [Winogradskyella maritima]
MVVRRGGEDVTLKGVAGTPMLEVETIVPLKSVSAKESELRQRWLKG